MRKYLYGVVATILVALNAALFFWRRSGGKPLLTRAAARDRETPNERVSSAPTTTPVAGQSARAQPSTLPPARHATRSTLPVSLVTRTASRPWPLSLDTTLFLFTLLVFLATRFISLDRFPIYFFTDEAIQSVQAANLVHNGFRDQANQLFPTYFQNGTYFNLSVSVYAQVIPYLLFGFSVVVTRGVSAWVALSGAAAVGLMLRDIFKVRFWWIGSLLLSIVPVFFLHSRTAFETVFGASFYAWFLYFYMRYRYFKPRNLYWALLFGALTFYSYSPMQAIMAATGGLLFLSDLRYHWQNRRTAALGLGLLIVLALPYLRFQADHPGEAWLHLRILDSYLLRPDLTPSDKIAEFWSQYLRGISPTYWYSTQTGPDLIRHLMKDYGRLLTITLPLALIGLIVFFRNIKSSAQRATLIALFVTPLGSAITNDVQVYRILSFVIPATVLTAIGLIAILTRLVKRVEYQWLAIGSFAVLSVVNFAMLNDALVNGLTWYHDYTIGGLQYGGQQIFDAVRQVLRRTPDTQVLVSPTWANGTDVLLQFFMPDEQRVQMGNIDAFKFSKLALTDRMLLVMTADEYRRTLNDPKFADIRIEQTLKYPDGSDGFYFVRLNYSPQADQIFAAEDAARRVPVREDVTIDGQTISVLHSQLDVGQIKEVFDGDAFTLVRTLVDNPFFLEMTFPAPRRLTGLTLTTGTLDFNLLIKLYTDENAEPIIFTHDFIHQGADPTVDLPFDPAPSQPITKIRIEVKDLGAAGDAHIHIREIKLR